MPFLFGYIVLMTIGILLTKWKFEKGRGNRFIVTLPSVICGYLIVLFYADSPRRESGDSMLWLMNIIILFISSILLICAYWFWPSNALKPLKFGAVIALSGLGIIPVFFLLLENAGSKESWSAFLVMLHCSCLLTYSLKLKNIKK